MKKIFITFIISIASLSGFSQSVTILPTSTLGGSGSSQWTTLGNNISYGTLGGNEGVSIGSNAAPFTPLHVFSTSNGRTATFENSNNGLPGISMVKYGGTFSAKTAIGTGLFGIISFDGATSPSGTSTAAYITANAKAAFSSSNRPTSLEFATTPPNGNVGVKMILSENGRLGVGDATDPQGTLHINYAGNGNVSQPILNLVNTSNPSNPPALLTRYSVANTTDYGVYNEVIPGVNIPGTSVRWRYRDNGSPSTMTELFGYSNNLFSVNGGQAISGSSTVTGTSGLTGKVTVGSSTATTAGVEIRSQTSTDANPDIYLKGTNNVVRFGNNVDGTSIIQTTTSANVPNTANLTWKHITNANPAVATPMMSIQGDGDLTVNGFTKLGELTTATTAGVTKSSPAMKTILLTGSMPNAATTTVAVPHGLTESKIIDVRVLVTGFTNLIVSDNYTPTISSGSTIYGFLFNTNIDGVNINIVRNTSTTSSSNGIITAGGITASYKIFITYIP